MDVDERTPLIAKSASSDSQAHSRSPTLINSDVEVDAVVDGKDTKLTSTQGVSIPKFPDSDQESNAPTTPSPPFPTLQICILLLIQLAEPVSHSVIIPFINQFVFETGITNGDYAKVGYYAGLVASLFFLTESILILHWGRLSDKIGRRPILLMGTFGLTISMLLTGVSKTFWRLVTARALAGALNGNVGVAKATLAEMCKDPQHLARAVAYVPVVWETGITLGPLLGGLLTHPYERYPSIFGHTEFFREYPYFLACASSAAIAFTACVMGFLFLKETRPKSVRTDATHTQTPSEPPPQILTARILIPIANYALLASTEISFWVLLTLFLSTPIPIGGLGFPASRIGVVVGLLGLTNGIFQAIFFPTIQRRWGPKRVFTAGVASFVPIFSAFPLENWIASRGGGEGRLTPLVWCILVAQLSLCVFVSMTWSCIFLIITRASPPSALGAANGLAQTTASIMRAIAPATATTLFALSVEHKVLGGYMVYVVVVSVASLGVLATRWLEDDG